jgi:hypothetical protein
VSDSPLKAAVMIESARFGLGSAEELILEAKRQAELPRLVAQVRELVGAESV